MKQSRREFCREMVAAFAVPLMSRCAVAEPIADATKPRAAVQLWSVHTCCERDLPGTFRALKGFGYAGVEFAGYYGRSAGEMCRLLGDHGLVAAGTHVSDADLRPDKIKAVLDYQAEIGNRYVVCPHAGLKIGSRDGLKEMAELLARAAESARPYGISVGYHNSTKDFVTKYDGKTAWECFFETTSSEVFVQFDIGNCVEFGGGDPLPWLRKFPGRAWTVHCKEDMRACPTAVLGRAKEGKQGVRWDETLPYLAKEGGCRWYIVECEVDASHLDAVRDSLAFLKQGGWISGAASRSAG